MDWTTPYELKHLRGIPYYVQAGIAYTFELRQGDGHPPVNLAMGTYDSATDSLTYFPDWRERSQSYLESFRAGLELMERANIRQAIVKPQKSRVTPNELLEKGPPNLPRCLKIPKEDVEALCAVIRDVTSQLIPPS